MEKPKKTIHIGYIIGFIVPILIIVLIVVLWPSGENGATPTPTTAPTATVPATPTGTPVPTTPPVGAVTVSIDSPETVQKSAGRYFYAYVRITSVEDFYAAQYDITYDPSVIRVQDVTPGDIDGNTIRIEKWSFVPANTQGTIRIINSLPIAMGASGVSGEGYLAAIYFRIYGNPGDFTDVSFISGLGDPAGFLMVGNNEGVEISSTWIDASAAIE